MCLTALCSALTYEMTQTKKEITRLMEALSGHITLFFKSDKDSTQYGPPKKTECLANTDILYRLLP